MRWRKWLIAAALLLIAVALAAANVWFAAARSTIPLQIDAVVAGKEVRHEKHPPKDDVCLLSLGLHAVIHVDREVFDRVEMNDRLRKTRWSAVLFVNDKPVELGYSADLAGMLQAMPLALLVALLTAVGACRLSASASA